MLLWKCPLSKWWLPVFLTTLVTFQLNITWLCCGWVYFFKVSFHAVHSLFFSTLHISFLDLCPSLLLFPSVFICAAPPPLFDTNSFIALTFLTLPLCSACFSSAHLTTLINMFSTWIIHNWVAQNAGKGRKQRKIKGWNVKGGQCEENTTWKRTLKEQTDQYIIQCIHCHGAGTHASCGATFSAKWNSCWVDSGNTRIPNIEKKCHSDLLFPPV